MVDAPFPFPPAAGVRVQWAAIPDAVRRAIEDILGAPVRTATSQPGGFSPGVAARLELENGARAFVKAVSNTPDAESPNIHRREARIAAALPADGHLPALRGSYDDGDWVALVFDDIDGRSPALPWDPDELTRVLLALHEMSGALTPSPLAVEPAGEWLTAIFGRWPNFDDDPDAAARLPDYVRTRLAELAALEGDWSAAVDGDTLLHLDTRADNLLLTDEHVFVVDWPWAAVGAPWVDLALFLPSVAMQGGPDPESLWSAHPLARNVEPERVDAVIAAFAGMLSWSALQPDPPGLPTLRAFQAAMAAHACAWLARRRGWMP